MKENLEIKIEREKRYIDICQQASIGKLYK